MYESEGITYQTGQALVYIFDPGHLFKGLFDPIPVSFIMLSLAKVDKALSKNLFTYAGITNGHGGARSQQKIANLSAKIPNTKNVKMPFLICMHNDPSVLHVSDGRHRLACLFELGFKHVWCVIPEEQYDLFQTHFV